MKKKPVKNKTYTADTVASMLGIKLKNVPEFITPSLRDKTGRNNDRYTRADIIAALSNSTFANSVKLTGTFVQAIYGDIYELFNKYSAAYYISKAAELNRRFILHIGPTNSGKTHDAIQRLMEKGDGTYLAPLRLLALEVYDRLNQNGVPCELLTGEEHEVMPGADVVSSTIEMCDYNRHYKVAVIDEAQMIADPERGAQWTKAICMVDAEEVHICLAPEAEYLISSMIRDFEGKIQVIRHERLAPLKWAGGFGDITDVMPGDALIVFSRRSVLELSAALADRGIEASVIYGALPPMSRREEVRKFTEGKTSCVVATDAIGMGISIPIKRIVFMETWKFDGKIRRKLNTGEIRQIAGRAGRYGIYPEGLVASVDNEFLIKDAIKHIPPQVEKYTIPFPGELVESGYDFTNLFLAWRCTGTGLSYAVKADITSMELLYSTLRPFIPETADKNLVFSMITCPAYESSPELLNYWKECAVAAIQGKADDIKMPDFDTSTLEGCELQYKGIDIYHQIMRRIGVEVHDADERTRICELINSLLEKDIGRYVKKCLVCGKKLPFSRKKSYCRKCYEQKLAELPEWLLMSKKYRSYRKKA